MLQLREKDFSDRRLLETALKLKEVLKGSSTKLIMNDRPDIAAAAGCDGVHLDQDDLPFRAVKALVSQNTLVGLSPIRDVLQRVSCPVVCIGGLFPEHIAPLLELGVRNVCLVRYLNNTPRPGERIREIQKMLKEGGTQ